MAKQEEGMSLFPEVFTTTRKLSDEQFGALIRAARQYQLDGSEYSGDDIAVDVAFQFISNQIDRKADATSKRTSAANKRWSKDDANGMQSDAQPMQSDAKHMQTDANGMQNDTECMQTDAPILSIPFHSIPIHSKEESKADKPPAPAKKEARKSYGSFGWVKLTDEEYSRLLNDLGQAEVKRCIAYVDESAQTTRNKNKWRDWNLVIRKCSRDGWGLDRKNANKATDAPRQLDEDEVAAIQRMLREDAYA